MELSMDFKLTKDEKKLLNITRDLFDYFQTDYIPVKKILSFLNLNTLPPNIKIQNNKVFIKDIAKLIKEKNIKYKI
jgi:beta-xylosidase